MPIVASGLSLDDALWLGVCGAVLELLGVTFDPTATLQIVCLGSDEITSLTCS